MPTYEYECEKCNNVFTIVQSMKDAKLTTCTKAVCAKKTSAKGNVRRLLGAGAGLIFKGSGFYITDYRSDNYKKAASKDTSTTPAPAAAAASKSTDSGASSSTAVIPAKKAELKPSKPAKTATK